MRDRKAFAECGWEHLMSTISVIADPSYRGIDAITPMKKPKGGELSVGNKGNNRKISSIRSAVERCIAHVKKWKIVATGYRGRLTEISNVIRVITSLEFYRLGW
jgi:DDE superfamily endonuclease